MTESNNFLTLTQLAKRLGLHRTTLLRMEQRGVIPTAKWASRPVVGRVYFDEDVKAVEKAIHEYFDRGGVILTERP